MMEYKGYFAKVEFDDDANIFHKNITIEARKTGKSLNVWVSDAISKALIYS